MNTLLSLVRSETCLGIVVLRGLENLNHEPSVDIKIWTRDFEPLKTGHPNAACQRKTWLAKGSSTTLVSFPTRERISPTLFLIALDACFAMRTFPFGTWTK